VSERWDVVLNIGDGIDAEDWLWAEGSDVTSAIDAALVDLPYPVEDAEEFVVVAYRNGTWEQGRLPGDLRLVGCDTERSLTIRVEVENGRTTWREVTDA
jgi:hypothetical protein